MILVVDPDADSRECTASTLTDAGFDVVPHSSLDSVHDWLDSDVRVDSVVTEYDLPDGSGLELLRRVRAVHPDAAGVLYTSRPLESRRPRYLDDRPVLFGENQRP